MNQLEFQRNHLQMDYYSESYQDFERDSQEVGSRSLVMI